MDFDTHVNLASGTILTPPTPADSGTTFILYPDDGSVFEPNMPVTLCPAEVHPDRTNSEIGYLTDVSGDQLTILRGQEGILARAVEAGWKVYGTVTAKTLTDIEDAITSSADKNYEQAFATASSITVTHNLGKKPSVTIIDSAGDEVEGTVTHNSTNQVSVVFSAAFSGIIVCN